MLTLLSLLVVLPIALSVRAQPQGGMLGKHGKAAVVKNLADPSKDTPEMAAKRKAIMAKLAAVQALQSGAKPSGSGGLKDAKVNVAAPQPTPAKSKTEKLKNLADPSKDSPRTAEKRAEIMAKVAAVKAASVPARSPSESAMPIGAYVTAQGQLQDLLARTASLERSDGQPTDEEIRALRAACASLRSSVNSQLR